MAVVERFPRPLRTLTIPDDGELHETLTLKVNGSEFGTLESTGNVETFRASNGQALGLDGQNVLRVLAETLFSIGLNIEFPTLVIFYCGCWAGRSCVPRSRPPGAELPDRKSPARQTKRSLTFRSPDRQSCLGLQGLAFEPMRSEGDPRPQAHPGCIVEWTDNHRHPARLNWSCCAPRLNAGPLRYPTPLTWRSRQGPPGGAHHHRCRRSRRPQRHQEMLPG
jgi:hypothetical protein